MYEGGVAIKAVKVERNVVGAGTGTNHDCLLAGIGSAAVEAFRVDDIAGKIVEPYLWAQG